MTPSKHLIIILIALTLLVGCDNSVKHAKANSVRQATNRANDRHNLAMTDSQALAPVRLIAKEVLLWSLMAGGGAVILGGGIALTYFFVGAAVYAVRDKRIQQIPLSIETRQYPVLVYGNGRRSLNLNNGERLRLSETSEANLPRIEATTRVQLQGLKGLITDNSKIINGKVTHQ